MKNRISLKKGKVKNNQKHLVNILKAVKHLQANKKQICETGDYY